MIIERQRLLVPYLKHVLQHAGVEDVVAYRNAGKRTLQRVRPDVVILGVDTAGTRPLELIRQARAEMPWARIVVLTRSDDAAWSTLARALGADAVLGSAADTRDLSLALAA
jgi:DNA-binding NarL/FixJ family response regulator